VSCCHHPHPRILINETPREVLINTASGFIMRSSASQIIPRVSAFNGTWRLTNITHGQKLSAFHQPHARRCGVRYQERIVHQYLCRICAGSNANCRSITRSYPPRIDQSDRPASHHPRKYLLRSARILAQQALGFMQPVQQHQHQHPYRFGHPQKVLGRYTIRHDQTARGTGLPDLPHPPRSLEVLAPAAVARRPDPRRSAPTAN
jgi:hypothetical protein|tara:strand:+ start:23 stop:637 length:615 start_codon:yes stop_codon:yes gene_type:complete